MCIRDRIQETPEDDLPGENGIAIRYSKDFNIVQANELLRSKQSDLTLMESKLIRLAVSQIMKGDKDPVSYTHLDSGTKREIKTSYQKIHPSYFRDKTLVYIRYKPRRNEIQTSYREG